MRMCTSSFLFIFSVYEFIMTCNRIDFPFP
jgi:hypothetical protein